MIYTEKKIYSFPFIDRHLDIVIQPERSARLQFIRSNDDRLIVTRLQYANIDGLYPQEKLSIRSFGVNELAAPVLAPTNCFYGVVILSEVEDVRLKPESRYVELEFLQLTEEAEKEANRLSSQRIPTRDDLIKDEVIKMAIKHPLSKQMLNFWLNGDKGGTFTKDFLKKEE